MPKCRRTFNHPFGWLKAKRATWYTLHMRHYLLAPVIAFATLVSAHGEAIRFTTVKSLDETFGSVLQHKERFAVTGQVVSIFHRDGLRTISIVDGNNGITFTDMSSTGRCRHGDIVDVSGVIVRNPKLGQNGITAHSLTVIGHAPLPETTPLDWNELLLAKSLPQEFKTVQGVVSSVRRDDLDVHWNWLTLRGSTISMPVAMPEEEYPFASLTNLVDAEVVLSGQMKQSFSIFAKRYFSPFGTNGVSVVRPAGDPFSAPSLGTGDPRHRQTVRAMVKAVSRNRLYAQIDALRSLPWHFIAIHLGEANRDVHPGDIVTVSGFQNLTGADLHLAGAVVRRDGRKQDTEEEAKDVRMEDLFTSPLGLRQVSQAYHGKLIRIAGTVTTTPSESRNTGVMRLREGDVTVEIQVSEIDARGYERAEEGCQVSATGLCIVELEGMDAATALPVHKRTLILPRTADDIRVVARPPWWTPPRLIAVIALLFTLLGAAMAWNKALMKRARRHGEELFREKIAHAEAEVKVEVRTRLAVELHDSISQSLTGVALQVDSAERANAGANRAVAGFLSLARQMLGSCRRELQSCLLDLRNRTFEEKDLSEAIRRTVMPLSENADVSVRFNVPRADLSDTTVHTILKIIRELVVNAIRHSNASHVRIAGERNGDTLRFSVRDDGCGFDSATAPGPAQGHFGLQGIRERTRDFSGSVAVESAPGRGTKVLVTMNTTRES